MVSQKSNKQIVVDALLRLLCVFIIAVCCGHISLFAVTPAQMIVKSFRLLETGYVGKTICR